MAGRALISASFSVGTGVGVGVDVGVGVEVAVGVGGMAVGVAVAVGVGVGGTAVGVGVAVAVGVTVAVGVGGAGVLVGVPPLQAASRIPAAKRRRETTTAVGRPRIMSSNVGEIADKPNLRDCTRSWDKTQTSYNQNIKQWPSVKTPDGAVSYELCYTSDRPP